MVAQNSGRTVLSNRKGTFAKVMTIGKKQIFARVIGLRPQ